VEFVAWDINNPMNQITRLPEIVQRVKAALPQDQEIYLVGGAVRDLLRGRQVKDFDFLVPEIKAGELGGKGAGGTKQGILLGRKVANALKADFYMLDQERGAGRVILKDSGWRTTLDFISMVGEVDEDLMARDVSINAMAIDLRNPNALLDPCGGASDLIAKRVKACSPSSFSSDAVRIIRAVRMAAAFGMRIEPETRNLMKDGVKGLERVSPERLRDEFLKLLEVPKAGTSIRALDMLGALEVMFPEIKPLRELEQPSPHAFDVWNHILQVLKRLDAALELLSASVSAEGASDMQSGWIFQKLGRYRTQIHEHLQEELVPDHSRLALLYFAAMFHDVGKAGTQSRDENRRLHFYDHEKVGAEKAAERGQALHLSNDEIEVLETVVRFHGRPYMLTKEGQPPSRRAIYRFFRDTGSTGIEICLMSLVDFMGKYDAQVPQTELENHLETLRTLLEAFFEHADEQVSPPILVDGEDLMRELGLTPGPKIGELLEAVREAQAAGEVQDKEGALELARTLLHKANQTEPRN
jgi:putative nucleotidyltransferase with HDIG domain